MDEVGRPKCAAEKRIGAVMGGIVLGCNRPAGHEGIHLTASIGLWWASLDNREVGWNGRTVQASGTRPL